MKKKKNNFVDAKDIFILFVFVFLCVVALAVAIYNAEQRITELECQVGLIGCTEMEPSRIRNQLDGFEIVCEEHDTITHEEFVRYEWQDNDCFDICWDWQEDCEKECIEKGCTRHCGREFYECETAVYEKYDENLKWTKLFIEGGCITGPRIRTWTKEVCVKEKLVRDLR